MCRSICLQANSFVSTSVLTQGVTWVQRVTTGDTGPRGLRWYIQKWAAAVSAACRRTFFLSQSDELVVHECCWAIAPATALSVETNTHTCCLPLSLCPPPSTFAYGNHCWMCSVTLESCIVIGLTNLVHFLIMLWHETQLHMYSEINCSTTKISGSCGVFSPSPYNGIGRYIFQRIYPQTHSAPRQSKEGEWLIALCPMYDLIVFMDLKLNGCCQWVQFCKALNP